MRSTTAVPFRRWTGSGPCSPRKRIWSRLAWKSVVFEIERRLPVAPWRREPDLDVVRLRRGARHVARRAGRRRGTAARGPARAPRCSRAAARARPTSVDGSVNENCSTLLNWCTRIMPRVSRPAAPASRRKQGENATYRSGSSSAARISPAWRLATRDLRRSGEVELVGGQLVDVCLVRRERTRADQRVLAHENRWQNRGEPLRREPIQGQSVERERQAGGVADPVAEARARTSCAARSISKRPTSRCSRGSVSGGGSPTRRSSRTSSSVEPSGTSE